MGEGRHSVSLHSDVYSALQGTRMNICRMIGKHPDRNSVLRALSFFHGSIQNHVDTMMSAFRFDPPCAKGCSYCCHLRVEPLVPEVILIAEAVQALPPEVRDRVRERVRSMVPRVSGRSCEERLLMREPCPLLEDNACVVYHCRPVPCRIYYSRSKDDCVKSQTDPKHPVYMLQDPVVSVAVARIGFQFGLRDAKISSVAVELVSALDVVFDTQNPWKDLITGRSFGEPSETNMDLDERLEEARKIAFVNSILSVAWTASDEKGSTPVTLASQQGMSRRLRRRRGG
jgi:Fe-S-cluster containining protein